MDYNKNYQEYLAYVKTQDRKKIDGVYYERHHILPRFAGGGDDSSNIVLLTAREHYLAHYLLMKIYSKEGGATYRSAVFAFMVMNSNRWGKRFINSRLFEALRHRLPEAISSINKGSKRRARTEEEKEVQRRNTQAYWNNISLADRKKRNAFRCGCVHSEDAKQRMKEARKESSKNPSQAILEGRARMGRTNSYRYQKNKETRIQYILDNTDFTKEGWVLKLAQEQGIAQKSMLVFLWTNMRETMLLDTTWLPKASLVYKNRIRSQGGESNANQPQHDRPVRESSSWSS